MSHKSIWKTFIVNRCCNFSKTFSALIRWSCGLCPYIYFMCYKTFIVLHIPANTFISEMKSNWSWSLLYSISKFKYFGSIFEKFWIHIHQSNWLITFFFAVWFCLVLVEARFITNKLEIFVFSLLLTNLRNIGVFLWWSDDRILCWINLALSFSVGKFCIRPSTSLAVMDLFKLLTSSSFTLIGQTYLGIHPFLIVSQLEGKWILKAFTNGFLNSLSICS